MNRRKISFIYCTDNERMYNESVKYIHSLYVPEHFEVEIIAISDAVSMTDGYNRAMKRSDAKYKVYLHQDVFIVNKNFISDVVSLFERNPNLGLLGMAGVKKMPPSAKWWYSSNVYGKVIGSGNTGKMDLLTYRQVSGEYEKVEVVYGFLMVTQYDLPWREDLFQDWCFYEASQSAEFLRAGFDVGVPFQDDPWCIHDSGIWNGNGLDSYAQIFLDEYSKDMLPLVSVLIPTYNRPQLFEQALLSVINQTYRNIEIIVCDDSTNDDTKDLIQKYLKEYDHIVYVKNEKNLGQFYNDIQLMNLANGEYINFLMDDDLFHPSKIEKMMEYYIEDTECAISLVTSHRQRIDMDGNVLPDIFATRRLFNQNTVIDGILFGEFLLSIFSNSIGEPTTVLFRKSKMVEPFGCFCGRPNICNVDFATWLNLLSTGKIVYISETLSYFRIHEGQQLEKPMMRLSGRVDFMHSLLHAEERGFFVNQPEKYWQAIIICLREADQIMPNVKELGDNSKLLHEMKDYYEQLKRKKETLSRSLPLVSIVMPFFHRPDSFEKALKSVLDQSYKNVEIIIYNDTQNEDLERVLAPYLIQYGQIKYCKSKRPPSHSKYHEYIKMASGDYIGFLSEDGRYHHDKISLMMARFLQDSDREISLAISHKYILDENGNQLTKFNRKPLFEKMELVSGLQFGESDCHYLSNLWMDLSAPLFRKSVNVDLIDQFDDEIDATLSIWLHSLTERKMVYLPEALSFTVANEDQFIWKRLELANQLLFCQGDGLFANSHRYREFLTEMLTILEGDSRISHSPEYMRQNKICREQIRQKIFMLPLPAGCISGEQLYQNDIIAEESEEVKRRISDHYYYDEKERIFINRLSSKVDYADGSEQELIDLFSRIDEIDEDGENLLPYMKDWSTKYHLSPVRNNLFECVQDLFKPGCRVLELGGGIGAATWWLGRRFASVDVIEGSFARAKANRLRNKNHDNVKVFVDDITKAVFPRSKYDLATLIGVLEYIPYFVDFYNAENVCMEFLTKVAEHLEDDGILMIAIENKLGVKYFAGCAEDHNGKLFTGINGYPDKSPVTFSKKELQQILQGSGFQNIQFYHCFPDYKLPKTIIREDPEMYHFDLSGILRGMYVDYKHQREHLMPDTLLIDALVSAGLLADFSNSFLVLCSKSPAVNLKTNPVITKYWNREVVKSVFYHKIEFYSDGNQKKVVRKPLFHHTGTAEIGKTRYHLNNEELVYGKSLSVEAYRTLLANDNYESLTNLIREVHRFLLESYQLESVDAEGFRQVDGSAIDFCLNNLVRKPDGTLHFVDRKWQYAEALNEDYVIFRNLYALYEEMFPYIAENNSADFVLKIMKRIFPGMDFARFEMHLEQESRFLCDIHRFPVTRTNLIANPLNKSLMFKNQILHYMINNRVSGK